MKKTKNIFKNLIIFELANNHMGDLEHGIKIIDSYKKFIKKFNFQFAFKLQYRHLNTFIHKNYKKRNDLHYIKRFNETKLKEKQLNFLINYIKKCGFKTIATPFDEKSVDLILKQNLDYIKIASCSFNDWPLLEKVVTTNKPLVLSTAGADFYTINNVVSFLKNRSKDFSLMHCVAQYPTPKNKLNLNRIDLLKEMFPNIAIGYSTHENPSNYEGVKIAASKGAELFEKHIGLQSEKYKLNKYSVDILECEKWLLALKDTLESIKLIKKNHNELESLTSLRRGVFVNKKIVKGNLLKKNDLYFAFPCQKNQLTANDFSKYLKIVSKKNINKDEAINFKNCKISNTRKILLKALARVKAFLEKSNIEYPKDKVLELSHHYGIKNFDKYGLSMITYINREYCKKILILLPGQTHPTQYHKIKEETFNVIYGEVELKLNNIKKRYKTGDLVTIKPLTHHSFFSLKGCIIEELSTKHRKNDLFYLDQKIVRNKDRKTILNYW